ncbi:MAG: hypothetical protein ACRD6X_14150 [Pyrinomonadaceae bacterium]
MQKPARSNGENSGQECPRSKCRSPRVSKGDMSNVGQRREREERSISFAEARTK